METPTFFFSPADKEPIDLLGVLISIQILNNEMQQKEFDPLNRISFLLVIGRLLELAIQDVGETVDTSPLESEENKKDDFPF